MYAAQVKKEKVCGFGFCLTQCKSAFIERVVSVYWMYIGSFGGFRLSTGRGLVSTGRGPHRELGSNSR
jgi:hypothetical protein